MSHSFNLMDDTMDKVQDQSQQEHQGSEQTMRFHSSLPPPPPVFHQRKKILLLGSSMTQRCFSVEHQGWGTHLASWYSRYADILNRGAGGYNSRWLNHYLNEVIGFPCPVVTVDDEEQHQEAEEVMRRFSSISPYSEAATSISNSLSSSTTASSSSSPIPSCKFTSASVSSCLSSSPFLNSLLSTPHPLAPEMTILFIGNNDAIDDKQSQHVSLVEYQRNLISVLSRLGKLSKNMIVLLVTTTPVNEELKPLHSNKRRWKYAEVVRRIVRCYRLFQSNPSICDIKTEEYIDQKYFRFFPTYLGLVDLWKNADVSDSHFPSRDKTVDRFNVENGITVADLHDGSHLNTNGNLKVFHTIQEVVNSQFPFFSPDMMMKYLSKNPNRRKISSETYLSKGISFDTSSNKRDADDIVCKHPSALKPSCPSWFSLVSFHRHHPNSIASLSISRNPVPFLDDE
jgi:hypothetical protein